MNSNIILIVRGVRLTLTMSAFLGSQMLILREAIPSKLAFQAGETLRSVAYVFGRDRRVLLLLVQRVVSVIVHYRIRLIGVSVEVVKHA